MAFWIASLASLVLAYLLGSIPTGYLAGRLFKGIDLRDHGSGSTGATNTLRILGKGPGLLVLLVDVAKGAAAILLARELLSSASVTAQAAPDLQAWAPWSICLAGLAALLGHARSIWLKFTGGKSVAAGLGVLLALSWPVGLGAFAVFGVAVAAARIVSLGSILAAGTAIVLIFVTDAPTAYQLMVLAGGLYVIVRHRANLQRLLAGTEPRLGPG